MELKTLPASKEPQAVFVANPQRKRFKLILKSAGPITIGGKGMPQAVITRDESYALDNENCKGILYVVTGDKPQVVSIHEEMENQPVVSEE